MTDLGAVFLPQLPPERLREVALAADASGLDELWLWEDCFREAGVSTAAAALAWTERVRVGVGLLPVPLRNVALAAMEMAVLHRTFPGRAEMVVGHGVQSWMGQVGARVASPLTLLGEHLDALRHLLAGEEVTTSGRYVQLDGVRLDWPPLGPVRVLAGAEGAKTLELSGRAADGTVLVAGTTPERQRAARERIDAGRAAAGREDHHRVVTYLLTATGPDAHERMARSRAEWDLPDAEDVAVAGTAEQVADAVRRLGAAGADVVVLQPTADDPDPAGFAAWAGEQVRPLLR
ncbi:LLM class flavin-dependent oxidoreductase [Pseudokineococcus marinus]|uniref:LLM class flavin-dependent oxidoreductase n=1 Tax=Pseudokineococcus marinus TaxID=351215 RepID=A0A849BMJ1_9ACTN|nr:LLM class flavin-dependent oxidoreductase [Pseudokineococcus marinus]NNH22595.1 LLM class flavin-dependent oxidoreductase [Pseudokineococcus marinus]